MDRKLKKKTYENIRKALYMVDMNNGFVNFGNMANPKYNELVSEQLKLINKFREENQLVNFVLQTIAVIKEQLIKLQLVKEL